MYILTFLVPIIPQHTTARLINHPLIKQYNIRINHPFCTSELYCKHEVTEEVGLAEEEVRYQTHIRFRLTQHHLHIHHHYKIIYG